MKNCIKYLRVSVVVVFVFLLFTTTAKKANSQTNETSFSFITDQDFFYIENSLNEDRNYTQGTSFSLSNNNYYTKFFFAHLKLLNTIRESNERKIITPTMSSVSIFGTAFTPRKIDSANAIVGDRPFAFVIGLSTNQVNRIGVKTGHGSVYESITTNFGLIGTNVGYKFQGFAHKYIVPGRPTDPKGWNTQISDGGKPTLLVNYERLVCFSSKKKKSNSFGIDGNVNFGGSVGYYDRVFTGIYSRLGWIDPINIPTWSLWGNSLSTANRNTLRLNEQIRLRYHEFFVFTKVSVNMVFRNSLLVGQRFKNANEYTLDYAWVINDVFDFDYGIAYGFHWIKNPEEDAIDRYIRVVYKNTMRSPEFDSKIYKARWHYFGSLGIQFTI